jgi:hypothetical protein
MALQNTASAGSSDVTQQTANSTSSSSSSSSLPPPSEVANDPAPDLATLLTELRQLTQVVRDLRLEVNEIKKAPATKDANASLPEAVPPSDGPSANPKLLLGNLVGSASALQPKTRSRTKHKAKASARQATSSVLSSSSDASSSDSSNGDNEVSPESRFPKLSVFDFLAHKPSHPLPDSSSEESASKQDRLSLVSKRERKRARKRERERAAHHKHYRTRDQAHTTLMSGDILTNMYKFDRSAIGWVKHCSWKDKKVRHSATEWAHCIDQMLEEGLQAGHSMALETATRRLAALHYCDGAGKWDLADVLSLNNQDSLLPQSFMHSLSKQYAHRSKFKENLGSI